MTNPIHLATGLGFASPVDVSTAGGVADIGAANTNLIIITDSSDITSFGNATNAFKLVKYIGTPTVHNSSALSLLGEQNRQMQAGDIGIYSSDASGSWTEWTWFRPSMIPPEAVPAPIIPAGTAMLFAQATAPTGWTKVTTNNDKALRVVSGTTGGSGGGTVAFSSVFAAGLSTGSTSLNSGQVPAIGTTISGDQGQGVLDTSPNGSGDHSYVFGSLSASSGYGGPEGGHTHTLNLDLSYLDVIICTKN